MAAVVVDAKLAGRRTIWESFGRRLAQRVEAAGLGPYEAVVPVPTEPGRARRRGLDHTWALAAAAAAWLDAPAVAALRVRPGQPDQGRLQTRRRRAAAAGAYRPATPVRGPVLLVDDVLTTGATLAACTTALHAAGAREIHAAVVARAGGHALGRPRQP